MVSRVQCMDCKEDVWFPSLEALRYHRKTDHGKMQRQTCKRCWMDFPSRIALVQHRCTATKVQTLSKSAISWK